MRAFLRTTCYALSLPLFLGAPSEGSPIVFSQATANALALGGGVPVTDSEDTGIVAGDSSGAATAAAATGGGSGSAYAEVLDGFLKASASGSGTSGGNGIASAAFVDLITLTSTTLPFNQVVDLKVTLDLDYTLTGGCGGTPQTSGALVNAVLASILGGVQILDSTCDVNDVSNGSAVFQAFIGQEFFVTATLGAEAFGQFGGTGAADAANTLRFFIDPLGDFSYTTASGNDYRSPNGPNPTVPEPAVTVLFATAAILSTKRSRYNLQRPRPALGIRSSTNSGGPEGRPRAPRAGGHFDSRSTPAGV